MDGGIRSSDNADLAAGHAKVVILSPLGASGMALPNSVSLSEQIAMLEANGANVRMVEPDEAAQNAIGKNPLSPETRAPTAEAGRAQGRAIASAMDFFLDSCRPRKE
jgi:NTE family protein